MAQFENFKRTLARLSAVHAEDHSKQDEKKESKKKNEDAEGKKDDDKEETREASVNIPPPSIPSRFRPNLRVF